MIQCSEWLKNCLWDYDLSAINLSDDAIILRALQYGEMIDIQNIQAQIGKQKIINILQKNTSLFDIKTLNFWSQYFHLDNLHPWPSIYEQLNTPVFCRHIG